MIQDDITWKVYFVKDTSSQPNWRIRAPVIRSSVDVSLNKVDRLPGHEPRDPAPSRY
jgi:hypothetical protein